MSLPQLAQVLAAHGRHGDTMLAHINPQEAGILSLLGGSGTINPHTGLPEYSWLGDRLNQFGNWVGGRVNQAADWVGDRARDVMKELGPYGPLILGAALGPAGLGVFGSAMTTGLGVGATYGLANHSLEAGLKAGLGAFSGANIASQISSLGASAPPPGPQMASAPATSAGATLDAPTSGANFNIANPAGGSFTPGTNVATTTPPPASSIVSAAPSSYTQTLQNAYQNLADTASSAYDKIASSDFGKGIGQIVEDPKAALAKTNLGYTEAAALTMPALEIGANKYAEEQKKQEEAARRKFEESQIGDIRDYEYDPETMSYVAKGSRKVKYTPGETYGYTYDPVTGEYTRKAAGGGLTALNAGGMSDLGSYSDGGRMLRGPGDGVSDSIPAMIGGRQPARLADGEFVIPARIVSELGNGSSEAGARKLYAMMDRIQKARGKTVGKGNVAKNSRAEKHLPA